MPLSSSLQPAKKPRGWALGRVVHAQVAGQTWGLFKSIHITATTSHLPVMLSVCESLAPSSHTLSAFGSCTHSDVACDYPLKEMLEFHRARDAEATILVTKVCVHHTTAHQHTGGDAGCCCCADTFVHCIVVYRDSPITAQHSATTYVLCSHT